MQYKTEAGESKSQTGRRPALRNARRHCTTVIKYVLFCVHTPCLAKICFQIEEDCPTFRPFTRESLAKIEARIEEVNEKKRELEKKRAEGEVNI